MENNATDREKTVTGKNSAENEKRYDYLIGARNHHYIQYHVWMALFIGINGALFAAYYNLSTKIDTPPNFEKLLILLLGYVAAFLFYCSSKGYHYWITNFTRLIHDYENKKWPDNKDRVYFSIANKTEADKCCSYLCPLKGANISTTKIISLFALILTYSWGILIISYIINEYIASCDNGIVLSAVCVMLCKLSSGIIITTFFNIFFTILVKGCLKSNTDDHPEVKVNLEKMCEK
jgi:hypothetical protein